MEQITTTAAAATQQAAKPTKQSKASKPQQAAAKPLAFSLAQGFRPSAGSALFAHTAAFLELTGMDKGKSIPRATVAKCLGDTAAKHHLNSTGFFEQSEKGVTVSGMGREAFGLRSIDPEMKAAFIDILTTGKTTRAMPATFTNPIGIKAI